MFVKANYEWGLLHAANKVQRGSTSSGTIFDQIIFQTWKLGGETAEIIKINKTFKKMKCITYCTNY